MAVLLVSVVAMFRAMVMLPVCVSTDTVPVAVMPSVAPTVPTVKAEPLVKRTMPVFVAKVATLLATLFSV